MEVGMASKIEEDVDGIMKKLTDIPLDSHRHGHEVDVPEPYEDFVDPNFLIAHLQLDTLRVPLKRTDTIPTLSPSSSHLYLHGCL